MDLAFVESLIKALDESSVDSLDLEREGTRLRLSKSPSSSPSMAGTQGVAHTVPAMPVTPGSGDIDAHVPAAPATAVSEPRPAQEGGTEEGLLEVTSPMVGTYYSAPAPDAPPYVEVGQRVGNGTVLCIIEAMKLMNELESEVEGTIAKVMVENAQPVEFGQVLFLIDPS